MPYIKKERRDALWCESNVDYNNNIETAGELNYWITGIVNDYMCNKGSSYQTINDIIGALEGCKLEFYRRVVVPYENKKKKQNGDVY